MKAANVPCLPREQVIKMVVQALMYNGDPFTRAEAYREAELMIDTLFSGDLDWLGVDAVITGRVGKRRFKELLG